MNKYQNMNNSYTNLNAAYEYHIAGAGVLAVTHPIKVQANNIKDAIRIVRDRFLSHAWRLRLVKITHISSGSVILKKY
jgi:hypothetical protein